MNSFPLYTISSKVTVKVKVTPITCHKVRDGKKRYRSTHCWNFRTPNVNYSWRNAPLTTKRCIWSIFSTNIGTEYFKHGIYSPLFFSSKCSLFHNSNVFGSCIIHILYIYSTNIGTEHFKHGIHSPFFFLFKMQFVS